MSMALAGHSIKDGAQAIGRSRDGLTTKIHAPVDALGNPVEVMLSAGQDHDLTCRISHRSRRSRRFDRRQGAP
jgi:hypothetical protein